MKKCSVKICEREAVRRTYCFAHYARVRAYGHAIPNKPIGFKIHGYSVRGSKNSSTYNSWNNMKQRCGNTSHPDFADYGGRGIKICKRWEDFKNFLSDMGEKPNVKLSIDRINNNKGYSPMNCRWTTPKIQASNRRKPRR